MLPLSFSCRQGSTGNERVFYSNDNWNLRIKRLEGIFSTNLTSGVDYGEKNMMNCNCSSWKIFSCTSCSFPILQLTINSSVLREESMKVVFFQKSLFSVAFKLFDVPLLLFSIATELTEHHTPKSTDKDRFSLSILYVPG